MHPLTPQNIEAELSYAYLHAVASHAGVSCEVSGRHEDNAGVDARLVGWGPFPDGGWRTEVDLKVQLKATIKEPTETDGKLAYSFAGIQQYNDLRSETLATPRILVVLFLPQDQTQWISHTDDALSLHNCAYWVSLRGAAESSNTTSQTVYIPKSQRFDVEGLQALMTELSHNRFPLYEGLS